MWNAGKGLGEGRGVEVGVSCVPWMGGTEGGGPVICLMKVSKGRRAALDEITHQ
jgi:hypothetical protein